MCRREGRRARAKRIQAHTIWGFQQTSMKRANSICAARNINKNDAGDVRFWGGIAKRALRRSHGERAARWLADGMARIVSQALLARADARGQDQIARRSGAAVALASRPGKRQPGKKSRAFAVSCRSQQASRGQQIGISCCEREGCSCAWCVRHGMHNRVGAGGMLEAASSRVESAFRRVRI